MALVYHPGQIEVQTEANTLRVAASLARWVGPVGEFATTADLILLATQDESGELRFTAISGRPPLVEVAGPAALSLPELGLPDGERQAGGLTISLERSQRARLNGSLSCEREVVRLTAAEAFTNCRKYISPSVALAESLLVGPATREELARDDAWLTGLLARTETSFLASINPEGQPDVSHRGGPPGFLSYDAAAGRLSWPEYIGDGMFKSAGNIRSSGLATLLVPDFDTGDAVELRGQASYRTLRTMKDARLDALQQHTEAYPVQGEMSFEVREVLRLGRLLNPRRTLPRGLRVTSASRIDDQQPQ